MHGSEAYFLAHTSLRKLRTAMFTVVWSSRQPLANTGAVLSLLDGPPGCDPAFCVVWFRFRMLRRYLAYRPGEVPRVYRLLDGNIGFQWDSRQLGWERLGLPVLSNVAGPVQHFRAAVLEARRCKVSADQCVRKGFRGGPLAGYSWYFAAPQLVPCSGKR